MLPRSGICPPRHPMVTCLSAFHRYMNSKAIFTILHYISCCRELNVEMLNSELVAPKSLQGRRQRSQIGVHSVPHALKCQRDLVPTPTSTSCKRFLATTLASSHQIYRKENGFWRNSGGGQIPPALPAAPLLVNRNMEQLSIGVARTFYGAMNGTFPVILTAKLSTS